MVVRFSRLRRYVRVHTPRASEIYLPRVHAAVQAMSKVRGCRYTPVGDPLGGRGKRQQQPRGRSSLSNGLTIPIVRNRVALLREQAGYER